MKLPSLLDATDDATEPQRYLRYCPHCGSAAFAVNGPKDFRCPSCGCDLFMNAAAATVALLTDGAGRLLLTHRARAPWKGSLDLPGGFADPGEGIEEALHREIREELDVEIRNLRYFASYPNEYVFAGYKIRTCDIAFLCEAVTAPVAGHDDVADLVWLPPEEIHPEQIALASIRHFVERWLAEQRD